MNLIHVNIEPTNRCQLNCKFCGDKKNRKTGNMDLSGFRKIIHALNFPFKPEIRLFLSGEPLLHPEIDKMVEISILFGHPVLIHSNGVALDKKTADKLFSVTKPFPGYLSMSFSVDGRTEEEYKTLRGPNLEKILKNLDYFIETNNNLGNPINITIQSIIPFPEPKRIPDYLYSRFKGVNFHIRYPHNWDIDKSIKNSENEKFNGVCGFLKDSLPIYWNGDCPICCADLNGRYIIGNIFKDGIENIIKKLDGFRKLQEKKEMCPPCESCERYNRFK